MQIYVINNIHKDQTKTKILGSNPPSALYFFLSWFPPAHPPCPSPHTHLHTHTHTHSLAIRDTSQLLNKSVDRWNPAPMLSVDLFPELFLNRNEHLQVSFNEIYTCSGESRFLTLLSLIFYFSHVLFLDRLVLYFIYMLFFLLFIIITISWQTINCQKNLTSQWGWRPRCI